MNTEKARLDKMLVEKKISQEDYLILTNALKRKSFFAKMHSSFWLNPFQKIAGFKALVIGMVILVLTCYLGVKAGLYYFGPVSVINASALAKQNIHHLFLFLLYQNVVIWLVLAVSFMIAAKILQKNKIRIIDFLGTVALARFPTLLITICIYLIRVFYPSTLEVDMSKGLPIHANLIQYLVSLIISTLVVWQAFTYFYAFKESSGLLGKKLLWGFLGVIILVQFIALPFTNSFMS